MTDPVGVIGLGTMGLLVADRLAAAGVTVSAFDIDPTRLALAKSADVAVLNSAAEVARQVDVVVTVLPGPSELRELLLQPGYVLNSMRPGSLWLDLTSSSPEVTADIAREARQRGVGAVAAPMMGGPAEATAGGLGFYLGGDESAVIRARPLLATLGPSDRIVPSGDHPESAQLVKLLANTLWFTQAVAVTEALLIGRASGIEPQALRHALQRSPGSSRFLHRDVDALLDGDYLTAFPIDRVVEELETVEHLAEAAGIAATGLRTISDVHREALQRYGPIGGELLAARLLEEKAGGPLRHSGGVGEQALN